MLGKSKSMASVVAMFCIAAVTAFAGVAHADAGGWGGEHGGHCDKHHRHDFGKLAKKLGLTDTQKSQAKAIFLANKDVVKPILTSLRAERHNLQTLIHADTIDEAAIRAETVKVAGIQADLNVNRAKVGAHFRAILTPAQLATLKTLRQKHQEKDDTTAAPAE